MRLIRPFLLLTATLLTTSALAAQARRTEYEISFPNAAQHEARVTVTFFGIPVGTPLHARMSRAS